MDPWYSLGRADMMEAASLALQFACMSGREETVEMLRCATERGSGTTPLGEPVAFAPPA